MSELTIRPAKISGVIPDSIAAEVGFEIGVINFYVPMNF